MLTDLLVGYLSAFPEFQVLLMSMGFLRMVNKPLFALVQTVVNSTDTDLDDKWWIKAQEHKAMKSLFWLLDWTASIKAPKGKK